MNITVTIVATVMGTPPRARTPRPIPAEPYDVVVTIPEVTSAEAPVAMRTPRAEYRWHAERLWGPVLHRVHGEADSPVIIGSPDLLHEHVMEFYLPQPGAIEGALQEYADRLIVDGELWRPSAEPVYIYNTFGLDQTPSTDISARADHGYAGWAARDRDLFLASVESCIRSRRGDSERARALLQEAFSTPHIEVLIEEAARFRTATNYERFAGRWPTALQNLSDATESLVGELSEEPKRRLLSDLLDDLVPRLGEWQVARGVQPAPWVDDATDPSPLLAEMRPALTRIRRAGTGNQRSILQVELLHDADLDAVERVLAALQAERGIEPYVVGAFTENVPAAARASEARELAARQEVALARRP